MGLPRASLTHALEACHVVHTGEFAPPGFLQRSMLKSAKTEPDQTAYRHGMALGWIVGRLHSSGAHFHWHHGATGGYRAFVGFTKSTATGVVVLANSGLRMVDAFRNTTSTDALGFEFLERLNS
jgi:CubicO group peptidase (beta-lactamase class C family)